MLIVLWFPAGQLPAGNESDAAGHWAFAPVVRPLPPVHQSTSKPVFGGNPVDAFIVAQLEAKGLSLSPEADRVALIRRLYLVLLGVPPEPEAMAAFVEDARPDAFDRQVDALLADPRYGERWGRHWLDIIRFAESNGFETNRERPNAWRFRDWVIASFNRDTPYDRFIRDQIAGDLLGEPTGTGFLVGGPVDIVRSPDPALTAQQRADELDDMVATTGTAFLGLTLGCARCHAHKFDPVSHREYYAMAALFNGVQHGEAALPLPPSSAAEVAAMDREVAALDANLEPFRRQPGTIRATVGSGKAARPAVNPRRNEESLASVEARYLRFVILASNSGEPCLDELEVWAGGRNVALASAGARATASGTLPGFAIHRLDHVHDGQLGNDHSWISNESGRGWVQLEFPEVERIERVVWGRDRTGGFGDRVATEYRIEAAIETNAWTEVANSADREPFAESGSKAPEPEFDFAGLAPERAAEGRRWEAELKAARERRARSVRPPMVYAGTFGEAGPAFRLHRGDPLQPREAVAPATLELFQPLTLSTNAPEPQRRRILADWIAAPDHPLTARVIVNRLWQHHFGVGLVDTPNDFGRNGSRPSHPELLDWLASELVAQGWHLKAIHRLILTSATWRQSSAPRAEGLAADAGSRLLWRYPPRRIEAEAIRDSLLAVSGDLDRAAGGPSFFLHDVDRENVYHYQPKEEFGPAESRRMVYAFKVRMEQDGIFGAFDCPDGSLVTPRRSVSTTPLQALNLFNSRFTLALADRFAGRVAWEAGEDPDRRVRRIWELAYGRDPGPEEASDAIRFAQTSGWPALCRAVLNSNEFLFIP